MGKRIRLIVAAFLFVGWLGWLGATALTKSHAPVVSRVQAANATVAVVAELTNGEDGRAVHLIRQVPQLGPQPVALNEKADRPAIMVKVVETLKGGPAPDTQIGVANLPDCVGYTGPGRYLLLLNKDPASHFEANREAYMIVGRQHPSNAELSDIGPPTIYPYSDKTAEDIQKQVKKLLP